MEPLIRTEPAFRVMGLEGTFTPATMKDIPALWGRFVARMHEVPGRVGAETFGVCRPNVKGPDGAPRFFYLAGVRVADGTPAPKGLAAWDLPPGAYAVFTHEGPIAGIGATFDAIGKTWIPASGLARRHAPEFERYDDRWDPETASGPVDIYIPVEPPLRR